MDNELEFQINWADVFERKTAFDYDTVSKVADNLLGLSELVEEKAMRMENDSSVLFFISDILEDFSNKLVDSEILVYTKKEPTPTTDQVQE